MLNLYKFYTDRDSLPQFKVPLSFKQVCDHIINEFEYLQAMAERDEDANPFETLEWRIIDVNSNKRINLSIWVRGRVRAGTIDIYEENDNMIASTTNHRGHTIGTCECYTPPNFDLNTDEITELVTDLLYDMKD